MLKRLNNELKNSKKLSHYYYNHDNNEVCFIHNDERMVSMTIPNGYPFYPPKKMHVNYQPIVYHCLGNRDMIRKYFNIQCICCESITCPNNWKPMINMENIVHEYTIYKTIINASIVFGYMDRTNQLPVELIKYIARYIDNKNI
jgi:hypothetical protein